MRHLDQLESRRMFAASLSNGVLTLTGTAGNDSFYVNAAPGGKMAVYEGSKTTSFNYTSVKKIVANMGKGNDSCYIGLTSTIPCVIDGGEGNDHLTGGYGNDSITAGAGMDSINGSSGNDTIVGGADNDTLSAGNGNDVLIGDAGKDLLTGGPGNDTLDGGLGGDRIAGSEGTDIVTYATRTNAVFVDLSEKPGELADDGEKNEGDFVYADVEGIIGGSGNDVLTGSIMPAIKPATYTTNNRIVGGKGNDTINGLDGNDSLYGSEGNDSILGGIGNDVIYGEAGSDKLFGNDGNDNLYDKSTPAVKDIFDGGAGTDKAQTDSLDTKTSVEGSL